MTEDQQSDLHAREVAAEQRFVDRVQTRLEAAARSAQDLAREGHNRARLGHEGGLVERDAMVFQAAKRLATLDAAHEGLVFGRLDLNPELDPEPRYIGRLGLRDENRDTLLIDWRAPAASVFYQATAATPQGVVRRRVLRSKGTTVIGVEDELLDDTVETDLPILGEGALMAQLSRARDRSMHSIVATIQAEQDEAIRAPLKGAVTISGGPGTGKTVVALHRAAYLLFTDRRRYETGGVLIIGPSGVFMRYIERVLPSLGETAVALRSLGEVVDGLRAERRDEPAVADVKGSARMAELMRRLSRQAVPGAPRHFRMFYRDDVLQLGGKELGAVRRQLLSRGRRNRQINQVPRALADALWRQVRSERGRERGYDEFLDDLLSDDAFVEFTLAWWPAVDGPTVLRWLREPEVLGRVAEGVLSAEEQALLAKSWADVAAEDFSVEDIPLVDELRYAVGDLPTMVEHGERSLIGTLDDEDAAPTREEVTTVADRELAGRAGWAPPQHKIDDDGYAHVLVDEAQDLTPMQWRMVGRRGRRATWTIVGDPAQSSWPEPREAQAARDAALETKAIHAFHLSKNYRNSAEIYDFAAAYADRVGLDADLPEAVRSTGIHPEERTVGDLAEGVRAAVGELAEEVAGTVGIVVPHARRRQVQEWLESWPEHAEDAAGGANARIPVLIGLETKGLEFDAIVVVEPDEIETESSTGRATLYVVYTRATQRMITVRGSAGSI